MKLCGKISGFLNLDVANMVLIIYFSVLFHMCEVVYNKIKLSKWTRDVSLPQIRHLAVPSLISQKYLSI